jgi:hypothetical protein
VSYLFQTTTHTANLSCRYRNHDGWVRLILIRKVTDIAAVGLQEKNDPERFETAFKGIPSDAWHVFETAEECYQIIKDVVARNP